jgi:uncharacterized Zn-finger protein
MMVHERQIFHKCKLCPKKFSRFENLRIHIKHGRCKNDTVLIPYSCDICAYKSDKKQSIENHLRSHDRERKIREELIEKNPLYENLLFAV